MLIGITGGIGSGKTTIARYLQRQGYEVFYCDDQAKDLINTDTTIQSQLIALLGSQTFVEGKYNTSFVAQKIFNDTDLCTKVNAIIHPVVKERLVLWAKDKKVCFVESAILYESGIDRCCDKIIVVTAGILTRLYRAWKRDDRATIKSLYSRMCRQMSQRELTRRADYTINNGAFQRLENIFSAIKKYVLSLSE